MSGYGEWFTSRIYEIKDTDFFLISDRFLRAILYDMVTVETNNSLSFFRRIDPPYNIKLTFSKETILLAAHEFISRGKVEDCKLDKNLLLACNKILEKFGLPRRKKKTRITKISHYLDDDKQEVIQIFRQEKTNKYTKFSNYSRSRILDKINNVCSMSNRLGWFKKIEYCLLDDERELNSEDIKKNNQNISDSIYSYLPKFNEPEKDVWHKSGFVYLAKGRDFYKIGHTKNVKQRIQQINSSTPFQTKLIHMIETNDMRLLEKSLQHYFDKQGKRVKGEWYNLTESDIQYIKDYQN